ncbi:MAG: hypothetical protein H7146_01160 [Burkholderiaceae bacterium]|nr:hypothetical protein [Microbacteriaceae bacterium]
MITLHQDADGFIRMNRHFPMQVTVSITFSDGAVEEFTGSQVNAVYDTALAEFRTQNRLDAKGFSRAPAKTVQPMSTIEFVPVHPGMAS